MSKMDRSTKLRQSPGLESLETRNLMSVLINAKPTLEVIPAGNRVREVRGAISIVQPAPITVTGTAQPPAANIQTVVQIFAKDSNGNLVNGGAPLATAVPDFSGQYTATFSLPSRLRRDVNTLFAREVAVGTLDSNVQINATSLAGLNGNLAINATTLAGLNGNLAINATTLAGLNGTISNQASTSTLNGTIITPATPITGIGGTITTPIFPTNNGGVVGTAGPAVSTLVGGTGTLDTQAGTIVGGTITTLASTSTLTQTGTAAIAATTGSSTQNGTAAIAATTGTSTQAGTAAIASTTGTSTQLINEVAVSEPITVLIHQSQPVPGATLQTASKTKTATEAGTRVHATTVVTPHAQTAKALRLAAARKRQG